MAGRRSSYTPRRRWPEITERSGMRKTTLRRSYVTFVAGTTLLVASSLGACGAGGDEEAQPVPEVAEEETDVEGTVPLPEVTE